MKVEYSAAAEIDLEDIGDWIAQDSINRAIAMVERIRDACSEIGHHPHAYPLVPRFADRGLRKRVIWPYLIFYTAGDVINLVRIMHGARDYEAPFSSGDV